MKYKNLQNNPLVNVVRRELDRMTNNWMYWFITLLGPLLSMWLIMNIFSAGVLTDIDIAVVDQDQTITSQQIIKTVDATSIARVARQLDNLTEAKELINTGTVDAVIFIPKDAEKNIFRSESANVTVFINNTNILKGGMLQSGLVKAFSSYSANLKVGIKVKQGKSLYRAMGEVIPSRLNIHVLFNPYANYSYFLATALLPLQMIIFILLTTIYAFGTELRYGTSKNFMEAADNSIFVAIVGKLLPYFFIFSLNIMVMNFIIFDYMGTPVRGSLLIIYISEFFLILTYQLLGVLLISILANMRFALSLASAYSIMGITFSGLTFPAQSMPLLAQIFSNIFPYTFWLKIFISQTLRGTPLVDTVTNLYVFFIFMFLTVIMFPRLKRIMQSEKFWGKL